MMLGQSLLDGGLAQLGERPDHAAKAGVGKVVELTL